MDGDSKNTLNSSVAINDSQIKINLYEDERYRESKHDYAWMSPNATGGRVGYKKILVVDDILFHLTSTKHKLSEKYDVYVAQSMKRMFQILLKIMPDLILLDINMPLDDGYKSIQKLKEDTRYANIPIVFLTAQADRRSVIKGIRLGAVNYVIKPFTGEKLIEVVDKCLRGNKINMEDVDNIKASDLEATSTEEIETQEMDLSSFELDFEDDAADELSGE